MMIGKSLLFAVVLVVLHVGAEKVCSYVPQNDCLDEWDCPSYYYMGQIQTIDDYVYAKFGGVEWQLIDEDCTNLPACPLIPTAEDEGIICEADAIAFAEELEKGYYEDVNAAELAALDVETMPEGTANDLDNCVVFDVYEVVCTGEDSSVEAEEKVCSYVPQNDCLDEWDCQALYLEGQLQTEDEEVYHKLGGGVDLIDGDCANLPACPLTPSAEDEGIICEADAVGFMGQLETYSQYIGYYEHASDAELAAMDVDTMPEGTVNDLNNCKTIYDVYEVVCTGGVTTTELETYECTYVADNRCLAEWACSDKNACPTDDGNGGGYEAWQCGQDEYMYMGNYPTDSDCKLKDCPHFPNYEDNNGLICEADGDFFLGDEDTIDKNANYIDHTVGLNPDQLNRPAGTVANLNNCKDMFDIYSVVCTEVSGAAIGCTDTVAENYMVFATKDDGTCIYVPGCTNTAADNYNAAATQDDGTCFFGTGKICSYVALPLNECLEEWGCSDMQEEYLYMSMGIISAYDDDCSGLPECEMTPKEQNEGVICEADAAWANGNHKLWEFGMKNFPDGTMMSDFDQTRPEGTSKILDNCYQNDVYEVVCVDPPTTTTELETTTSAPAELCETYTTAASCPASYCVIKNDRNGAFKKCKRVGCKTFNADEAACEWSAECQPKYKKDGSFKKCLLKKNLV